MDKQLSAHQFKTIYKDLGIDINSLGCVMLDTFPITLEKAADFEFYTSKDPAKFWINGWVADKTPHITLLYGLLTTPKKIALQVKTVLQGWQLAEVEVLDVDYFESPYEEEPYYCIIATIKLTDKLLEGHNRLEFLPHINTFAGYKPHLTLGYLKKDEEQRTKLIEQLKPLLIGKKLKIKNKLNLGDK